MKNKIICLLTVISVLCTLSLTSCNGQKAGTVSDEYFTYTLLKDGTYSVKAKDKAALPEEITVPATFNGKNVTEVAKEGFSGCDNLRVVTLSEGITGISYSGFSMCDNLEELNLPSTMDGLDNGSVAFCPKITSVSYAGTTQMWYKIYRHGNRRTESPIATARCSDGTVELD